MFPIDSGRNYAVITGDIIDSSSLTAPERRRLPDTLHAISDTLVEWRGEDAVTPIAVFGGDSWQVLLREPGSALRCALFVRASLLASDLDADTRIAIAVGGVDFVPDSGIEEADGEAFRLSGRLLKEIPRRRNLVYASHDPAETRRWDLVCRLVGAIVDSNWTVARDSVSSSRGRAVSGAMRGWTHARIAKELWSPSISREAVTKSLDEANWESILAAIEEMEACRK